MNRASLRREHDLILVSGVLDFLTVGALLDQGLALFGTDRELILDLAEVERANSAGLALLLEWLDVTQRRGQALRFRHLPESLLAIAGMSHLEEHLPLVD